MPLATPSSVAISNQLHQLARTVTIPNQTFRRRMSTGAKKGNTIRHIVRLRQMLRRWRNKARSSSSLRVPPDVPEGHVAVCVGDRRTRFVVRATHLNHPAFRSLLARAEEEYGFAHGHGPIAIPCDESVFLEAMRLVSRAEQVQCRPDRSVELADLLRLRCHVGAKRGLDLWAESRPLLEKTVSLVK